MPDENPVFAEYACSLGTVIAHDAGSYIIRLPDGRVIGILANGDLSAANVEADIAHPYVPPVPVPAEVTPFQIRRALSAAGLRATVEAAVAAAPDNVRDAWEYATAIQRDNALLAGMAAQLDLTSTQVDDLFRAAGAIEI